MAKKDLIRKKTSSKKESSFSWGGLMLASLLLGVMILGVLTYRYKHQSLKSQTLITGFSKIESWFKQHTERFHKVATQTKPQKPKTTTAHKEDREQIHFEFYTALPNMQVSTPALLENKPEVKKKAAALVEKVVEPTKSSALKNVVVVSQDELEQEFSDRLQQKNYIVQLGIFQTQGAAERYQKSLSHQGLKAKVAKGMIADKEIYRVQLGPFNQKDQAKLTEKLLQKKGISSITLLSRESTS